MNSGWLFVVMLGVGTFILKGAGALWAVMRGGRAVQVSPMLTPAVLAALVATAVLTASGALVVDERAVAVAVGWVVLARGAPILVGVAAASATAALLRLLLPAV